MHFFARLWEIQMIATTLSERLTDSQLLPWRARHLGGPVNTLFGVHLRRQRLLYEIKKNYADKPNDITVMVGIKNRVNYRLENSLKSLRSQSYPERLITILVVDYGNEIEDSIKLKKICTRYNAKLLTVNNRNVWNKSHCFNIAIKNTSTKYLMTNDADMIYSSNYIEEAVNALKKNPLNLILGEMRDLPCEMALPLKKHVENNTLPNAEILTQQAKLRKSHTQTGKENENAHISILITYTLFFKTIHGYDEFYEYWGLEDNDMYRRFYYFGLKPHNISNKAFYLHQWHEKFEGLKHDNLKQKIKRNRDYYYNNHSIIRNKDSWGELPMDETTSTSQ